MRQFSLLLLAALLMAAGLLAEDAKTSDAPTPDSGFDKTKYQEIERNILLAAPEEFKNKRVSLKTRFAGFNTNFPPYMEASGAKASKYYWLRAGLRNVPLLLPKDKGAAELVASLKEGSGIAVYGKVRKFKRKPKMPGMTLYYLEAEFLEPAQAAGTDKAKADKEGESEEALDKDIQDLQEQLTVKAKKSSRGRKGGSDSPFDTESDDGGGEKAGYILRVVLPVGVQRHYPFPGGGDKDAAKDGAKKELWFE